MAPDRACPAGDWAHSPARRLPDAQAGRWSGPNESGTAEVESACQSWAGHLRHRTADVIVAPLLPFVHGGFTWANALAATHGVSLLASCPRAAADAIGRAHV